MSAQARDRSRPGQVHPGQRRRPDPRHHGVRRQVRRPDLPGRPEPAAAGGRARCSSRSNVSTEVNTVFQNLVGVLDQVDPAKLNAVLTALAEGVRGQGERIGQATTDANQVLLALNPRSDTIRADWQALQGFQRRLRRCGARTSSTRSTPLSTTSVTITNNAKPLDALLLNVIGLVQQRYRRCWRRTRRTWSRPSTSSSRRPNLLMKYNPEYTCMLVGRQVVAATTAPTTPPAATASRSSSTAACWSVTTRTATRTTCRSSAPRAVPAVSRAAARCRSSTRTGRCASWSPTPAGAPAWTSGPTPVSASPAYANYLPVTRGVPEPPSIRNLFGGPAPGPYAGNPWPKVIPEPGDHPYGAPMYGPDGTPIWNDLPPAPPPGAPRDPGATPGSEPFVVPFPGSSRHRCRPHRYPCRPRRHRDQRPSRSSRT